MRLILNSLLVISTYTQSFGLWAYMNNYQFHVPGEGPYMEVVITVDGKTIDYKEVEPTFFRSSIELVMVVYQGNEIVSHKKSILESENLLKISSQTSRLLNVFAQKWRIHLRTYD